MKKLILIALVLASTQAEAIPAFARKFNVPCSTCHLAPPYLNATGRKFMEAGYRMPDEDGNLDEDMQNHQQVNDNLVLEKMLPFAMRIRGTPVSVTAQQGQPTSTQYLPFSDFDILAMGNFYKYGSFMFALGAGAADGFIPSADGRVGIHPAKFLNVIAGWGPVLEADPYNTFRTDDIGLTQTLKTSIDEGHDSGVNFTANTEFLELYGRAGMVFYEGGIVGSPNVLSGDLPQMGVARVAIDPIDNLSFGAFGLGGRRAGGDSGGGPPKPSTAFRTGVDANGTVGDLTGVAAFVVAGDQLQGQQMNTNYGGFLEGIYAIRVDGRPILLPVARLDWVQQNGGLNQLQTTLDLSSYVFENVRVGVEGSYAQTITQADGALSGSVFADVVF
jgi:hypothetical protein